MKKLYFSILSMLFIGFSMTAQSIVVPPNLNGTTAFPFTYLSDFITADTTAAGAQAHNVYLLETGSLYFFTSTVRWTFDVALKATGDPVKGKPVVARANKAGGTDLVDMYRGFGNFTWDGVYLIMGEEGPMAAQYETAPFRPEGDDKRFIFNDCIIEKCRQGTIRIEGENTKTYITNCWIRNFGDYEKFQGNGRLVDTRDNFADSIVIRNNVTHNILDRLFIGFRQKGLNYFEYSQNTLFNHVGRHGLIQLKNTKESIIKDNLFMNPSIMGTAPSLTSEQINWAGVTNYLFSIDTMVAGASMEMSNNNIFWTQDVLDHYASFDSVTQPLILSPEVASMLANPADAYFTEVVELNNVPARDRIIKYAREAMMYKDSVGITDIMVEDISFAGSDYDKGYLFDMSKFDPCYPNEALSAKSASDGGAVGVRFLCDYVNSTNNQAFNPTLEFQAVPNPARDYTSLKFVLSNESDVNITIFDYQGRVITNLINEKMGAGEHSVNWSTTNMTQGMYFANIQTEEGKMFSRIIIQ